MTTYSKTFEISENDLTHLKTMISREWWHEELARVFLMAQRIESNQLYILTVRDRESIFFERWLANEAWRTPVIPPQNEPEIEAKECISYAYSQKKIHCTSSSFHDPVTGVTQININF